MGTISNKTTERLDEKLVIANGDVPNFIKLIKEIKKDVDTLKIRVSILSAR